MIGYNDYPLVLHTSFTKEDAPEKLWFEVEDEQIRNYLANCKGFQEMFVLFAVKNTQKCNNSNTHFYLDDSLFHKIDANDFFRQQQFSNFLSHYIKPKNGVILFKDNGQYVYMLLSKDETKKIKGRDGRYIAVAFFKQNYFVGFEEGIITEKGIEVLQTGHYYHGMDKGGYISFVLITLAYAGDNEHPFLKETKFKENVYAL